MKYIATTWIALPRELIAMARAFGSDRRGVAAVEFAVFAFFLFLAIVNVTDASIYIFQRMEAENATQGAAQAALTTCGLNQLPATTNCPGLATAIQNALGATSLGTRVALVSGSPSEGYYCVNSSSALQYMSGISSKPADCSAVGAPGVQPGDYIQITTSFGYAPLFPGLSIASTFATPVNTTTMMRLS